MKQTFFHYAAAVAVALGAVSCSNQDMPDAVQNVNPDKTLSKGALEAVEFANDFLGRSPSRSGETPQVLYILNEAKSRSEVALPDTLAYVVNYPEQSGYAVVMNSDRPDRVLAFSETGNFDPDDEVVNAYFTSRIGSFMASPNVIGGPIVVGPITWLTAVKPVVVTPIYEDKYEYSYVVNLFFPEAYAGTGPVAIAKAMLHAKDQVPNYNDGTLYCKSIRNAFTGDSNSSGDPTYALNIAKRKIAQTLHKIGSDLGTQYGIYDKTHYSRTDASKIAPYLRSYGYEVTADLTPYNFDNVRNAVIQKNIVIIYGERLHGVYSEDVYEDYWVCDGCNHFIPDGGNITDAVHYIHISWGNSSAGPGAHDGYFRGNIFDPYIDEVISSDLYAPLKYIAVKLEPTYSN